MSIISPLIDLPLYLHRIGIIRPAITLETIGSVCLPISKIVFYKFLTNSDLSTDI
jgi:hypothetical protein